MRIECWIPKATNTHTHGVCYSLLFHRNMALLNFTKLLLASEVEQRTVCTEHNVATSDRLTDRITYFTYC